MNIKLKFTIARKITFGFGLIMLVVITTNFINYRVLDQNLKKNLNVISNVYTPSASRLQELQTLITNCKILIKNWVWVDKKVDSPDKKKLRKIQTIDIPETEKVLEGLVAKWNDDDQKLYKNIQLQVDSMINLQQNIMNTLNTFESYEDIMNTFTCQTWIEEDGDLGLVINKISKNLNVLIQHMEDNNKTTNENMKDSFAFLQQLILVMALLLAASVILIGWVTTRTLLSPIGYLKQIITQMSKGVLPQEKIKETGDEIGEMAQALNLVVNGLKTTSEFSLKIGEGEFSSKFTPLSKHDVLGNSLVLMRENLKKAALEEEKRKKEDNQRSWAAQGLAKFSELLRQYNNDLEDFSFRIISRLVKYLDANQGGFFIINDNNPNDIFIELVSCYAYGRQKFMQRRVEIGVTLVGQCVQEKQSIYLTDIPKDYIKITSGLGSDNPRSLLIIPLKLNDEVFGVVEIASFNVFEQYQIEFIEKLSESIAASIQSVKINMNTNKLLGELREKSERLAQKEEEVRQNIDRMQNQMNELVEQNKLEKKLNTQLKLEYKERIKQIEAKLKKQQESLTKQDLTIRGQWLAINNTLGQAEYAMNGDFTTANERFLEMTGVSLEQFNGKNHSQFMLREKVKSTEYQQFWSDLNKGTSRVGIFQYFYAGKEKWFSETYTPVKDENGNMIKIIVLSTDVTAEYSSQQAAK